MIAKIGHGINIIGALSYNLQKVEQGNAQVLLTHKMRERADGTFRLNDCLQSFEPYLSANRNTEKPSLHISLNPDPADKVDDNRYIAMAEQYMREMGYGEQPYIVFKHSDIERTHIHIVSTNVDRQGKKIPDTYEHRRSMQACRNLEKKFGLSVAKEQKNGIDKVLFKPVDYRRNDIKSQIASVVRYLPKYYNYQSFGAYNALLSLFNITAQEVTGERDGKQRQGIVYFALDALGQKAGNPFKASLFGKNAGYTVLQSHFEKSEGQFKNSSIKSVLKNTIELTMHTAAGESDFKSLLVDQGINTVVRRNNEGRIYGITFIDHDSRSVWNGSQLEKGLSANVFNNWWNEGIKPEGIILDSTLHLIENPNVQTNGESTHRMPDTLNTSSGDHLLSDVFGGLLPSAQGEDHEERAFANSIKKRKRGNK